MKVFIIHRDGRVERSLWMAAEFDYLITGDTLHASRSSMDSLIAELVSSGFPRLTLPACRGGISGLSTMILSVATAAKRASANVSVVCSAQGQATYALRAAISRVTGGNAWNPRPLPRESLSPIMANAGCYQLTFGRPTGRFDRDDMPFEVELAVAPARSAPPLPDYRNMTSSRTLAGGRYIGSAVWRATADSLELMWTNDGLTVRAPLVRRNGVHEGVASLSVEGQGVSASSSVIANRVRCRD